MTTQVANTSMTLGSIFGMVTTAANSVTNALAIANDGMDMMANSVDTMKKRQLHRNKVDNITFESSYIEQAAQVRSGQLLAIQEFRNKSEDHAAAFDSALAEITNGLKQKEA